ncbi:MAG: chromate transporter, partial [Bacteroides sp.]|nr:chromate transporter [Bacteroides sp.]
MIYLQLLWVYLKIGTFGFGGGYAMLSLIQHEIVDLHHWLTPQQFTDVVAISQMTPG